MRLGILANRPVFAVLGAVGIVTVVSLMLVSNNVSHAESTEHQLTPKGIYGKDNRKDVYEVSAMERRLAQASVVFFTADELEEEEDAYVLRAAQSLQETGVCGNERFAQQPTAGFCSGFLVAEDMVVTAGHCVTGMQNGMVRVVFGFAMDNHNEAITRFAKHDVYRIDKVLESFHESKPDDDPSKKDWGIIRLDRPAVGHIPVEARQGETPIGEAVTMIGYPLGLPVKISTGKVMASEGNFLITNLDAFHGDSGSAVFNTASIKRGEPLLEGILVNGKSDFVNSYSAPCTQIKHFANSEAGEKLTKINLVIQYEDAPPPPKPSSNGVDICKVVPELCEVAN